MQEEAAPYHGLLERGEREREMDQREREKSVIRQDMKRETPQERDNTMEGYVRFSGYCARKRERKGTRVIRDTHDQFTQYYRCR